MSGCDGRKQVRRESGDAAFARQMVADESDFANIGSFFHAAFLCCPAGTSMCQRLVIGTGTGALPVMKEVKQEAKRRKIELLVLPTAQAIKALKENPNETNAIL